MGMSFAEPTSEGLSISRRQFLTSAVAGVCGNFVCAAGQAQASVASETPLPTDSHIRVVVLISGHWVNLTGQRDEKRSFTLPADVACYPPNVTPTRRNFDKYRFLTMRVPQEPHWGGFYPEDEKYTLRLLIADDHHRLAKVVIKDMESDAIYKVLRPERGESAVIGSITLPWNHYYVVLLGYDRTGKSLFCLATGNGEADTWVPFLVEGGFTPKRFDCVESKKGHYVDASDTPVGDPYKIYKNLSELEVVSYLGVARPNSSWFTVNADAVNDNWQPGHMFPPHPFDLLRRVAAPMITAWELMSVYSYKDSDEVDNILNQINNLYSACINNTDMAFDSIELPPYSDNTGYWKMGLTGKAYAAILVPYRRVVDGANLAALKEGISAFFEEGAEKLTHLVLKAGERYLNSPLNNSGFFPDDLDMMGNIYTVTIQPLEHGLISKPLTQEVTLQLKPQPAPPAGWPTCTGEIRVGQSYISQPPPPADGFTQMPIRFDQNGKATVTLAKGWNYEVTAHYYLYTQRFKTTFGTPPPDQPIPVYCELQVLLRLRIKTVGPDGKPMPARVRLIDVGRKPIYWGTSQPDGNGGYECIVVGLPYGYYKVEAVGLHDTKLKGDVYFSVDSNPFSPSPEQSHTVQLRPMR